MGSIELSKRSARKLAQPILDAANHQTEIPVRDSNAGITLAEFIPDWRKHVANSLKPSTLRGMESSIRAHLLPVLGAKPMTGIDTKTVQEQNGKVTAYAYDDADRLTTVTDAANNITTYGYDTESNLTSIEDANLHTTSFAYDARVSKLFLLTKWFTLAIKTL